MYGMDLSNYQRKINLEVGKDKYDFCIIKATEGIGYTDNSFYNYVEQLTRLNKLIGCYHFARPDLHQTIDGMQSEANYFYMQIDKAGIIGKAIIVLDWEKPPFENEELIMSWVNKVEDLTGVKPFIYGSKSKLNDWKNWKLLKEYPVWLAAYPSIKTFEIADVLPTAPLTSYEYKIWQYTNNGIYPRYNGRIDLDVARIDREEWIKLAAIQRESMTPAMEWCIDKGIFVGDGNGNYFPKEPLTREQAAQVIYTIYNKYFVKE